MDAYEATRIVFSRIQTLDPDNAPKIMGLLLLQDHGEKEMIRLAFGPEALVHSVIIKARKDLGLLQPSTPSTPSSPSPFSRQNSTTSRLSSSALPSPSSWAPPPPFSRTNSGIDDDDDLAASAPPFYPSTNASPDLIDDFQLQDHLSFLNDPVAPKGGGGDLFYGGGDEGLMMGNYGGGGWGVNGHHRRSCSVADLYLSSDAVGFGWKPCLYFAKGYCKNGSSCRFQHGLPEDGGKIDAMVEQQFHELLLRSKSQRLGTAAGSTQLMPGNSFPYASLPSPTSGKCVNFLLQQQQNESQRAAAAAALMLAGDEHKFLGRSRMDRYDYAGLVNPGSRQIYLTFPADSTFREEDVSNYFSIYGPVQDVRIPYQQKRMFGFVTFVYPETVKLILAKGNPHFVCDARVLVKPYKEKGKVPDKKLQQHQSDRGDFSGCSTPTGLDSRDPYDLQQLGARMLYNNSQEVLLRRKLEEQQQAELQQSIELQQRRFMGLQLLDLKARNFSSLSSPSPIHTPTSITTPTPITTTNQVEVHEDKSPSPVTAPAASGAELSNSTNSFQLHPTVNSDNEETAGGDGIQKEDGNFQDSGEHNLPDSPFASPTKSSFGGTSFSMVSEAVELASNVGSNSANHLMGSSTLLPSAPPSLDMASIKSCFFPMPRFSSSGHGAVGL